MRRNRLSPCLSGRFPASSEETASGTRGPELAECGTHTTERCGLRPLLEGRWAMRRFLLVSLLLTFLSTSAPAQSRGRLPPQLEGVKFEPLLKEQLPLQVRLRDDQGREVTLQTYCGGGS